MDQDLIDQFRALLQRAAKKIDRQSFEQEPHYTAALFGKLHNEQIHGKNGQYIELKFSSSNDHGPNTAEKRTGVDIGMVFRWLDPDTGEPFEKAVLAQAKNNLLNLPKKESIALMNQCEKMRQYTESFVAMDCPYDLSIPKIGQSSSAPPFWKQPLISLDDYLIDIVFQCNDGDTNGQIVEMAKHADRRVTITTNSPKPKSAPRTITKARRRP